MEKIIVTAKYQGEKEDKITALIEAAQKAKEVADATESRLQPLIDAAGEKKWELICEQLQDFANRYETFLEMTGDPGKWGRTFSYSHCCVMWYNYNREMLIRVNDITVDAIVRMGVLPSLCKDGGLVTEWNNRGVIEYFDSCLENLIREYTKAQENRKIKLERTAKNMMN